MCTHSAAMQVISCLGFGEMNENSFHAQSVTESKANSYKFDAILKDVE